MLTIHFRKINFWGRFFFCCGGGRFWEIYLYVSSSYLVRSLLLWDLDTNQYCHRNHFSCLGLLMESHKQLQPRSSSGTWQLWEMHRVGESWCLVWIHCAWPGMWPTTVTGPLSNCTSSFRNRLLVQVRQSQHSNPGEGLSKPNQITPAYGLLWSLDEE